MKREADDLAQKAESAHDFSLLNKYNAFRNKITEGSRKPEAANRN